MFGTLLKKLLHLRLTLALCNSMVPFKIFSWVIHRLLYTCNKQNHYLTNLLLLVGLSLEDFNLYVLCGLLVEFKDLVTSLVTKTKSLSYAELHSHLLTHEFLHKNFLHSMDANSPLLSSLCYRSHHYSQHLLPILLHLITTLVSILTGVVLVKTNVPTTTIKIIRTGPQLLPTRGRTNGSKTDAI